MLQTLRDQLLIHLQMNQPTLTAMIQTNEWTILSKEMSRCCWTLPTYRLAECRKNVHFFHFISAPPNIAVWLKAKMFASIPHTTLNSLIIISICMCSFTCSNFVDEYIAPSPKFLRTFRVPSLTHSLSFSFSHLSEVMWFFDMIHLSVEHWITMHTTFRIISETRFYFLSK